jgi:hypothetical protein
MALIVWQVEIAGSPADVFPYVTDPTKSPSGRRTSWTDAGR